MSSAKDFIVFYRSLFTNTLLFNHGPYTLKVLFKVLHCGRGEIGHEDEDFESMREEESCEAATDDAGANNSYSADIIRHVGPMLNCKYEARLRQYRSD